VLRPEPEVFADPQPEGHERHVRGLDVLRAGLHHPPEGRGVEVRHPIPFHLFEDRSDDLPSERVVHLAEVNCEEVRYGPAEVIPVCRGARPASHQAMPVHRPQGSDRCIGTEYPLGQELGP